jgi:predicted unusual protein kinase regulating ubiquinone biosynthesis (AarF/ABC1/UbiB family)
MTSRRLLATTMAGGAAAALVLMRRRLGPLRRDRGRAALRLFARWDPRPIAAASIGQVHRAVTLDGRAVAVKVQYPGIAETIAAGLRNVALLRRMLRIAAPAQDVDALLTELRDRVGEELDYRREAASQRLMAAYYDGHPIICIPGIIDGLSTRRVITSELSGGAASPSWPAGRRANAS